MRLSCFIAVLGLMGCSADADCPASAGAPLCEAGSGARAARPPGHELGLGDGSPGSVRFTVIYEPDEPREPSDLEFNPAKPGELWVVNRRDDSVIIIENACKPGATWEHRRDPAASHFMDRPPALAFGVEHPSWGMTWATCGDSDNGGNNFMGPTLFSADLDIFAEATPGGLGSHLDMLHSTTFCRGIAHAEEDVFWVLNSARGSLDKYNFNHDHGPGNDDHADGEIYRYAEGEVAGVEGIPSHLSWSPDDRHLYIADTGNQRVVKLDTESGALGATFPGDELVTARQRVDGAVMSDVVPAGLLEAPSGLEVHDGLLYVSDSATSRFYVFDMAGKVVRTLDTGLAPGSLAGLTFGPDQKIYFVDMLSSRVVRIDPR